MKPMKVIRVFSAIGLLLVTADSASAESLLDVVQHTHVHGISFSRGGGSAAFILATHHGIYAVESDGSVSRISIPQDFMGFTADPSDPLRYLGSGHPADGGNSGVMETRDGGTTWKKIADGLEGPVDFHALSISLADPRYAYGAFGGIQISSDGGKSWKLSGALPEKTIALAASSTDRAILYAATRNGIQKSSDGGQSWQAVAFKGEVVSSVLTVPGGGLYAFVAGKGLMAASDTDSGNWTPLYNGFGDAIPLHMAAHPQEPGRLVAATLTSQLFESRDAGKTWTEVTGVPE
jgi:photosystem II stability/assembly factor-like uncharacterized protein